jgi:hypothetical protein
MENSGFKGVTGSITNTSQEIERKQWLERIEK